MATPSAKGNEFAQSLVKQFVQKGKLSEKQWFWVGKLTEAPKAAAAPKAATYAPGVWNAFQSAAHMEADWPQVQLVAGEGRAKLLFCKGQKGPYLKLSYTEAVKPHAADWVYVGIALPDDEVRTTKAAGQAFDAVLEAVSEFGEDMLGALKAFGAATGTCGCCGRALTHPASVALAIGPICAGRIGIGAQWKALAVELTGSDKMQKGGE
jgi:hypothetical protein